MVTAAAGIEPESAAALSSGVGHTGEGARKAIADNRTSHLAGPGVCHHNRVASDGKSVNTEAAVAHSALLEIAPPLVPQGISSAHLGRRGRAEAVGGRWMPPDWDASGVDRLDSVRGRDVL